MVRDKDPRVKKLLEFGEKIRPWELIPTLHEEAALLIEENPFAFALAAVLDRGTKAEIIWTIPYYMKKHLGHLDPYFFAKSSIEDIKNIFQNLPVKPRYINDAPFTVKELAQIVVREFDGKTQKIWEDRNSEFVKKTFKRIHGVGPGISSMIVLLLERCFKIQFNDLDHKNMDIKPDVHTIRVFYRLGISSEPNENSAVKAARRLNPEYPGALDAPAWIIGRRWCSQWNPNCSGCPLNTVCPKIGVK